jgi:N-acetylneuraminic acid mutarotase
LPDDLGEVAGGIIGTKLYLVGDGSSQTFAYDIASDTWTDGLAARPHVGDHHAAEVVNGKLYLFGGFDDGAPGAVQVYDPAADSWSLAAPMPFAAGSPASALIGGRVYVAGGIVNFQPGAGTGVTTTQAAVYDPAADAWQPIAPMPLGVNHAASATDGARFYVFGGRGGSGGVLNGVDAVQVYDPATNAWQTSDDPASGIAPMPLARAGTGKAVFADGEFFVFGGETQDGPGATADGVFDRVDAYDPAANTWRQSAPMPTPRHGIFPAFAGDRIYVAAGGTKAAFSRSSVLEILELT